jgi:hypothetical protein
MADRSDFEYRVAIFRYKRLAAMRKWFRKRQEDRGKPRKKGESRFKVGDWILRLTIEKQWFSKLPQKPEINLVLCGNGRRYIIECYPGKSKKIDESKVKDLESAWKDYKTRPKERRQLVLEFIAAVIGDAADAGHIHDLSDTKNAVVSGIFRAYKISCASGKDVPLADPDLSVPAKNEWIYRVPGSTLAQAKKVWELNHSYNEKSFQTQLSLDQPDESPDAIRIRPRRSLKPTPLPPLKKGVAQTTKLIFGRENETGRFIEVDIKDLCHFFGAAMTGGGKTWLFESIMHQMLTSLRDHVEGVYFIDTVKKCRGLEHLEKLGATFARTNTEAEKMINGMFDLMQERDRKMVADPNHGTEYKGKIIFFGVDEGQALFRKSTPDIASKMIDLSAESRSFNFKLMMFTQSITAEFVPTGYLDNFGGRICLRVWRMMTATNFLGIPADEIEHRPNSFKPGEFIMYLQGWPGPRYGRSFISNRIEKR